MLFADTSAAPSANESRPTQSTTAATWTSPIPRRPLPDPVCSTVTQTP